MITKFYRESVEKSIGGWMWRRSWGGGPSGLDKLDWYHQARPAQAGWASAYAVSTSSTGLDEHDPLARSLRVRLGATGSTPLRRLAELDQQRPARSAIRRHSLQRRYLPGREQHY